MKLTRIKKGHLRLACLSALFFAATVTGCGGSGGPKAPLKGKVVFDGKPVTAGSVNFSPVSTGGVGTAKMAMAKLQSDGTFVAGTDEDDDGAALSKFTVSYIPPPSTFQAPEWDGKGAPPKPPKGEFDGLVPKEKEIEVKEGGTEVTIELVKAGGK